MASLAQKVSVSVASNLLSFVKEYKQEYHLRSDSEVINLALRRLEKTYLESCYKQSANEMEKNSVLKEEAMLWEHTAADGIASDSW